MGGPIIHHPSSIIHHHHHHHHLHHPSSIIHHPSSSLKNTLPTSTTKPPKKAGSFFFNGEKIKKKRLVTTNHRTNVKNVEPPRLEVWLQMETAQPFRSTGGAPVCLRFVCGSVLVLGGNKKMGSVGVGWFWLRCHY